MVALQRSDFSRTQVYAASCALKPCPGLHNVYGSIRQKIEIKAIESLQQLFARSRQVCDSRRVSVMAA